MNETFQCGDAGALVAYLYDECAPGEQELIAAHLRQCATCASEVEALRSTRRTLVAWAPPELELGFQITRSAAASPAQVLTPKIAWWRAPLPAWAQAAAALVIFAAGLSVGLVRNGAVDAPPPVAESRGAAPATPAVSHDELAQLEQRIKAELGQLRSPSPAVPVAAHSSSDVSMQQVKSLIEDSEANQRRDFTLRMVDMADIIERQRRVDLAQIGNSMGQFQGAARNELRQQDEAFRETLRRLVSDTSR